MGFISGLGKAGLGLAKGVGKATGLAAKGTGFMTAGYGSSIIKNAMKSPVKTAITLGAAGAAGYMVADMDKHPNPSAVVGSAMLGTAAVSAIPGASTVGLMGAGAMVGAAAGVGGLAMGLGQASIKLPKEPLSFSNMGELKFSAVGKGLVLGSALYEGVGRAANKFVQGRMGTNDGMMRTSTPTIPQTSSSGTPSYANNGGATGDLVFSLYNNR